MVNLGGSAFPSEDVRTDVRVGSDQSLVGTWAAQRPAHSLAARLGWGGFASIPHALILYIYRFAATRSGAWAMAAPVGHSPRLENPRAVLQ
jgi:hypothetical protein